MPAGLAAAVALALALALATSCTGPAGRHPAVVHVLAAASLTEPLTELARRFEASHPGVDARLAFAGSSSLARQIETGAPADVVVSADEETMRQVVGAGLATPAGVAARNRLMVAVAPGNPLGLSGVADLSQPGLVVVLCAPAVPCGRLTAAALRRAGVTAAPAALETNVKAVLGRVALGEADAGVVYATDVGAAGGRVAGVGLGLPDERELLASYPVALTPRAARRPEAAAFVELVLSPAGRRTLARHGFLPG